MNKLYARQIDPVYQKSPMMIFKDEDCYNEGIYIYGNRFMYAMGDKLVKDVVERLKEVAYDSQNYYDSVEETLESYDWNKTNGEAWTAQELSRWTELFENTKDNEQNYIAALQLLTGHEWAYITIAGNCQGDWQDVLYDTELYDKKDIKIIETEYFNTGSEWIIHDSNEEPGNPDDIAGYCFYAHAWDIDDIKAEIAKETEIAVENIVLYEFDGYTHTPNYKLAE